MLSNDPESLSFIIYQNVRYCKKLHLKIALLPKKRYRGHSDQF